MSNVCSIGDGTSNDGRKWRDKSRLDDVTLIDLFYGVLFTQTVFCSLPFLPLSRIDLDYLQEKMAPNAPIHAALAPGHFLFTSESVGEGHPGTCNAPNWLVVGLK